MDIDELMLLIDQNEIELVTLELMDEYYLTEIGTLTADLVRNYLLVHLGNYETTIKYYTQIDNDLSLIEHRDIPNLKAWNCYVALEAAWRHGSRLDIQTILRRAEDRLAEIPDTQFYLWMIRFGRLDALLKYLEGDLAKAIDICTNHIKTAEKYQFERELALLQNNLGNYYRQRGQITKAVYFHKKALPILKRENLVVHLGNCYENIALCYNRTGEYSKVLEPLMDSLTLREQTGNSFYLSWTLYTIIKHYFQTRQLHKMGSYLEKLEYLHNTESNHDIKNRYLIAKGLTLRATGRYRKIVSASNYFRKVMNDPVTSIDLIMDAKLYEAELMVEEAFVSHDDDAYTEAGELLDEIIGITYENVLFDMLITAYILKSRLYLLKQDFVEGKAILMTALELASLKELDYHSYLLQDEIREFESSVRDIQATQQRNNIIVRENQNFSHLGSGFPPTQPISDRTNQFTTTSKFVVLMVHHVNGQLLHSRSFKDRVLNNKLMSTFYSMVTVFGRELFNEDQAVQTGEIGLDPFKILCKTRENIIISLVTDGPSYAAQEYANHILTTLVENESLWVKINQFMLNESVPENFLELISMMIEDETKYFAIEL